MPRIMNSVPSEPSDGGSIIRNGTLVLPWRVFWTRPFMLRNDLSVLRHSKRLDFTQIHFTPLGALALAALLIVHIQLDTLIDIDQRKWTDLRTNDATHRRYHQSKTVR